MRMTKDEACDALVAIKKYVDGIELDGITPLPWEGASCEGGDWANVQQCADGRMVCEMSIDRRGFEQSHANAYAIAWCVNGIAHLKKRLKDLEIVGDGKVSQNVGGKGLQEVNVQKDERGGFSVIARFSSRKLADEFTLIIHRIQDYFNSVKHDDKYFNEK